MTVRVLHCLGGMVLGGAETFVMNVYRNIDRGQIQFDFAVSADRTCHYDDEIRALGGRIHHLPPPARVGALHYRDELAEVIRRCGPFRAVHSHVHYFSGWILATAAREGVPLRIAHLHSTSDGRRGPLRGFLYHGTMRWLMKRYGTHILGCSRSVLTGALGERWVRDPRISVVHNGIALQRYFALAQDRPGLCRKFSIPLAGTILGHIGAFVSVKNHSFLIQLFRCYKRRDPNAILILIGDGELKSRVYREVEAGGLGTHVYFMGERANSDIPSLLAVMDAFVMPSLYEGVPIALVEAQAAGVPCVVSDTVTREADLNVGLVRFIKLDRGLEEWCEEITAALKTPRPAREERLCAIQAAGYDIEQSAKKLVSIYQNDNDYARHNARG